MTHQEQPSHSGQGEPFSPQEIDMQTGTEAEHYLQDTEAIEITRTLRQLYHNNLTQEDQLSLARVKSRLQARQAPPLPVPDEKNNLAPHAPVLSQPPLELMANHTQEDAEGITYTPAHTGQRKKDGHMPQSTSSTPIKKRKIFSVLNSLVAILIVGLLIGSWFAATNLLRPRGIQNVNHLSGGTTPVGVNSEDAKAVYILLQNKLTRRDPGTGKVIWEQILTTRTQNDKRNTQYTIQGNVVYVMLDHDLFAFATDTGKQLWHTETVYARNFTATIDDKAFYISDTNGTFSAYAVDSGKQLWHNDTQFHNPDFSVQNRAIYAKSILGGDKGGAPVVTLHALDASTGAQRWQFSNKGSTGDSRPVYAANGIVYVGLDQYLYALNEQSGKLLWQQKSSTPYASFSLIDAQDSTVYTINDQLTHTLIGCPDSNLECNGKDISRISAFNTQTGKQLWQSDERFHRLVTNSDTSQMNFTSGQPLPVTHNLLLGYYQPAPQKNPTPIMVTAFAADTGSIVWQFSIPIIAGNNNYYLYKGNISGDMLYLTNGNQLITLDLRTGKKLSERTIAGANALNIQKVDSHFIYIIVSQANNRPSLQVRRLSNLSLLWEAECSDITTQIPIIEP